MRLILLPCFIFLLLPAAGWAEPSGLLQQLHQTPDASLLMEDSKGRKLHQLQIHQPLIPASTLKLLTAYASLKTWGPQHRFHTDYYLDEDNRLLIKGYGDPFLISEELDIIVSALQERGLKQVNGITTDSSFFCSQLSIDGQSETDNPYDAAPGALASNFNTIYIKKSQQGLSSAEPQTPITALSAKLAESIKPGKHRINLGRQTDGAIYFAELLRAKLLAKNIQVTGAISQAELPGNTPLFYRHYNSRPLSEIIKGMLEYSNNFIANQLFLLLGAEIDGPPASMQKSRQALHDFVESEFKWTNYHIIEGAGLSRQNSLSAQQLVDVLHKLKPYAHLLPIQNDKILAKTGTLQQVSSYAGYIRNANSLSPFALIINQTVDPEFRFRLAETLASKHASE